MVFTREHEKLVKEGEKWMRTTAKSCSTTAASYTTIVFAAAITVPGGSNQETGIPLFRKNTAFIVFAISDTISLFASSTALVVFLSILTARFAKNDFLVSLPRRLLIGLCALLVSTTSMMVAFSATLFLVFCDQIPWMLAPICGLAFIPISFFYYFTIPPHSRSILVQLCIHLSQAKKGNYIHSKEDYLEEPVERKKWKFLDQLILLGVPQSYPQLEKTWGGGRGAEIPIGVKWSNFSTGANGSCLYVVEDSNNIHLIFNGMLRSYYSNGSRKMDVRTPLTKNRTGYDPEPAPAPATAPTVRFGSSLSFNFGSGSAPVRSGSDRFGAAAHP
ncbi:hypothetical protein LXL04_028187 [Taraxacum kok-saghyz]